MFVPSISSIIRLTLPAAALFVVTACAPLAAPESAPSETAATETTAAASGEAEQSPTSEVIDSAPVAEDEAAAPVTLALPELGLEMPVEPMDWVIAVVDGERVTTWEIPEAALGWHADSAGAGAAGNTIISGHQVKGDALLAPLARGELTIGQEILVTDSAGNTFVYRIARISDPLPVTGAGPEEEAAAADYVAPSESAVLTLLTGWPDFTTTHRIFAQAELVGQAAE
jgi:sortase (surface protein transpeptidase)